VKIVLASLAVLSIATLTSAAAPHDKHPAMALGPPGPGGLLFVRVTDTKDEALPCARIVLEREEGDEDNVFADTSGETMFFNVPAGDHEITIKAAAHEQVRKTVSIRNVVAETLAVHLDVLSGLRGAKIVMNKAGTATVILSGNRFEYTKEGAVHLTATNTPHTIYR